MKYVSIVVFLLVSQFSSASSGIEIFPDSMTVITSNARPVLGAPSVIDDFSVRGKLSQFKLYNLDDVRALEDELSFDLPANEHLATQVVKHRLSKMTKPVLEQRVMEVYTGIVMAIRYRITHYPAIIFDGEYVVVGVNDLTLALDYYKAFKRSGGEHGA